MADTPATPLPAPPAAAGPAMARGRVAPFSTHARGVPLYEWSRFLDVPRHLARILLDLRDLSSSVFWFFSCQTWLTLWACVVTVISGGRRGPRAWGLPLGTCMLHALLKPGELQGLGPPTGRVCVLPLHAADSLLGLPGGHDLGRVPWAGVLPLGGVHCACSADACQGGGSRV